MKNKDIIALIVRIAGGVGTMYVVRHWGYYWHRHGTLLGDHIFELIFEVFLIIVGIGMIMAHPFIMRLLFPEGKDKDDQNK